MLPREYFVWHTFSILFSPSPPSFRRTEIVKFFKSNPNLYLIWSPELSTWHSHNVWLTLDSWSNQLWINNLLKRIIEVIVYYRFIYCWFFYITAVGVEFLVYRHNVCLIGYIFQSFDSYTTFENKIFIYFASDFFFINFALIIAYTRKKYSNTPFDLCIFVFYLLLIVPLKNISLIRRLRYC